jgi:Leucine-rich repeat (LRR) protein
MLQGSGLRTIKRGAFRGLHSLASLPLSSNSIEVLEDGVFTGNLTNLRRIELYYNAITNISLGAFQELHGLNTLQLGSNRLVSIPKGVFRDLGNLTTLALSSNQISSLEPGVFEGLRRLQYLDLQYNRLSILSNDTFIGLGSSMSYLSVHGNSLISVSSQAFKHLSGLAQLDLSHNRLATVARDTFGNTTLTVHLNGNPLVCMPEGQIYFWSYYGGPGTLPLCPYEVSNLLHNMHAMVVVVGGLMFGWMTCRALGVSAQHVRSLWMLLACSPGPMIPTVLYLHVCSWS